MTPQLVLLINTILILVNIPHAMEGHLISWFAIIFIAIITVPTVNKLK